MVTTAKTKKVKKKAIRKAPLLKEVNARVSITKGQAQAIANFYTKQGKKAPAFLLKSLV